MSECKEGSGEKITKVVECTTTTHGGGPDCCAAVVECCEEEADVGRDVLRFLRNHPATTLAMGVGAGVFLGRFFNKRRGD